MDSIQRFISEDQNQLGYIMSEASRQCIAKETVGAFTVEDCNVGVQKHGQYHDLLEKAERLERALDRIGFYCAGIEFKNVSGFCTSSKKR